MSELAAGDRVEVRVLVDNVTDNQSSSCTPGRRNSSWTTCSTQAT